MLSYLPLGPVNMLREASMEHCRLQTSGSAAVFTSSLICDMLQGRVTPNTGSSRVYVQTCAAADV